MKTKADQILEVLNMSTETVSIRESVNVADVMKNTTPSILSYLKEVAKLLNDASKKNDPHMVQAARSKLRMCAEILDARIAELH